ncbi:hypothetical protein [Fluviicola sp.]|uniref:hypothetical protein n=1 Tax=Fluviicola sp. TaxID=1917219 RepID=UPI003D2DCBD6
MYFTCETSTIKEWKISITGQTSGATKIISGTSKVVDVSNSVWNGSTTNLPMFKAETCDVMLTFTGAADTLHTTVIVSAPKVNQGFLIADFETGWNSGWGTFIQSGASMDFNIKTDATAPQNGSYYNMQGTVNWDWLIGLVDFKASAYGSPTLPLTDNAGNLYFNVLIYGAPGYPNSLVLLRFDEDENVDGTFTDGSEDQYSLEVPVTWTGWKLVSLKYSDLVGNGNGNGVHNPNKLNKVSVLHLANPASGFAKSGIDYLIFTENAALNP